MKLNLKTSECLEETFFLKILVRARESLQNRENIILESTHDGIDIGFLNMDSDRNVPTADLSCQGILKDSPSRSFLSIFFMGNAIMNVQPCFFGEFGAEDTLTRGEQAIHLRQKPQTSEQHRSWKMYL